MKTSLVTRSLRFLSPVALFAAAALATTPLASYAGGNESAYYDLTRLQSVKTHEQLDSLKVGDTVIRSCPNCGDITVFTLKRPTKGNYELLSPKCEHCGKEGVIVAAKTAVHFKETVKR